MSVETSAAAVNSPAGAVITEILTSGAARSPWQVAAVAAAAVAAAAGTSGSLEIHGLHDRATADLAARFLPGGQVREDTVPYVRFGAADVSGLFSKDIRRNLRCGAARVLAAGLDEEIRYDREPSVLAAVRGEIEAAHRARDVDARRPGDLDDAATLAYWRAFYDILAAAGQLEVVTLRYGGRLAAYTVAITDYPAYRVFDSRMAPGALWWHLRAGRRCEAAMLAGAQRRGYAVADWMSGSHGGALIAATGTEPRWTAAAGPA